MPKYAVLAKDTIQKEITPHLSIAKRGFTSKFDLLSIVMAMLFKLKTGCQWEHLPVCHFFEELLYRGYSVDVGVVKTVKKDENGKSIRKQFEVDFVANDSDSRYYIQSAYAIPDEEKMNQETNSFRNIDDFFKRVLIVKEDTTPYRNDEGILVIGLYDFLLNHDLMVKG